MIQVFDRSVGRSLQRNAPAAGASCPAACNRASARQLEGAPCAVPDQRLVAREAAS